MKKFYKHFGSKAIALIMAVVLTFSLCPVMPVHATNNVEYTILEAVSQSNLKEDCYAKSKTVATVCPGDLVYAVSAKTNEYNNLWYCALFADSETGDVSEAYAYSGEFKLHECTFQSYAAEENASVTYCRCGKIQFNENGVSSQHSDAMALPGGLLSPEDIEAVLAAVAAAKGYISGAGASAVAGVKALATNPYLIIPVVVSGTVFLVTMLCDGLSVSIHHVRENYKDYSNSDLKNGVYYCALVLPDSKNVLFLSIPETEMNIDDAAAFMTAVGQFSSSYKIQRNGNREYYGNVYTPNFTDAERLCKKLTKSGLFTYGGDGGTGTNLSVDKQKIPGAEYYRHFHLYYAAGPFSNLFTHNNASMGKVPGSHIFWGAPVGIRSAA